MSPPLPQLQIEAWPPDRMAAFGVLQPAALYIASTDHAMTVALLAKDGSVEKRFGGNRGVWPAQIGVSFRYEDTVTKSLRGADSFQDFRLRWRRWFLADGDLAERFLAAAQETLGDAARENGYAELLHGRIDLGPGWWRMHRFTEASISPLAREMGVRLFPDAELGEFLDQAYYLAGLEGKRTEARFPVLCRELLAKEHALSRAKRKPTPRVHTQPFGVGIKARPWGEDTEAEIAAFVARARERVA